MGYKLEWLEKIYDTQSPDDTMKALVFFYEQLNGYLVNKDIDKIEYMLKKIMLQQNRVKIEIQVGALRVLYPIKNKLNNWDITVKKVKENLINSKLDPTKILRGIIT